jgi:hypothetical protein
MKSLEVIPVSLAEANVFVRQHHRHHQPVPGAKFCLAVSTSESIVGVVIVGRPIARLLDDGWTLEITRTCTDGTKNVTPCSTAPVARGICFGLPAAHYIHASGGGRMQSYRSRLEVRGRRWLRQVVANITSAYRHSSDSAEAPLGNAGLFRRLVGRKERSIVSGYQIAGRTLSEDDPRFPEILASLHGQKYRPLCVCADPHPEMYIAKLGSRYLLKRMPNTGSAHDPSCESFEPPAELSGLGGVLPAIQENVDEGTTSLKLAFSLTKIPGRTAPVPSGKEPETPKSSGSKLGLRSTLHYLWEEAGFSRWSPAMAGKRNWPVIRKYLLQAATNKLAKGSALNELLYVPEPFFLEHKDEIVQRRLAHLHRVLTRQPGRAQQLMLLVAEVKQIVPVRFGQKLVAKQLPDCPFMLSEDLHQRIVKVFESDLSLWNATEGSHLVVIGTFTAGPTGILSLQEVAFMTCNHDWIPIENPYEDRLITGLGTAQRRFVKGLRYQLPSTRPLASVVLSDTQPRPVACYIVPPGASAEYEADLEELIRESELASWCWRTETEEIPPFPPRLGYGTAKPANRQQVAAGDGLAVAAH